MAWGISALCTNNICKKAKIHSVQTLQLMQTAAELQAKQLHTGYHSSIPNIRAVKEVHSSGENGRETKKEEAKTGIPY